VVKMCRSDALSWQGMLGDLPNVISTSSRNWRPNRTVSLQMTQQPKQSHILPTNQRKLHQLIQLK